MSDLIRVVDLEVWTRIGVPEEERAKPQRLLLTLEMQTGDIGPAAAADDISLTIDYFRVAEHIQAFAAERPRKLLETFAEQLAAVLLDRFPIRSLRLEVKKFILPDARHISVEIERPRREG
jgi:FolB domain-containing protein